MPPRFLAAVLALVAALGCNRRLAPERLQPPPAAARFSVSVHEPPRLTSIETDRSDPRAQPLRVTCVTCHSLRASAPLPASAAALHDFHRGLAVRHGALECASCHDPDAPSAKLRLASGRRIPMTDAMDLCGQCHGPQLRDYSAGAHGGMRGHWDLSRGARERNHCVDCHDPHAPRFVGGLPMPGPRDRFLHRAEHEGATAAAGGGAP